MPENHDDVADKRNRIASHLEGSKFKAIKGSDIDPTKPTGTTVINRDIILQDMLKLVHVAPMDSCFKEILRIRLTYPDQALEMFMMLGNRHGIRLSTILQMEQYAKDKIVEYLKKSSLQDAINEFNAMHGKDSTDIKNKMASEKDIIKGIDGLTAENGSA